MATTHPVNVRNAATDAVVDLIDAGAAAGKLKFRLAGALGSLGAVAATLTFSDPAFGASSSGVATAGAITPDSNATGNASAIAVATLEDSDDNPVIHCAVAASASDINMTGGLTIGAGDIVECDSLTYTALAA
jgi:hypothetical protein